MFAWNCHDDVRTQLYLPQKLSLENSISISYSSASSLWTSDPRQRVIDEMTLFSNSLFIDHTVLNETLDTNIHGVSPVDAAMIKPLRWLKVFHLGKSGDDRAHLSLATSDLWFINIISYIRVEKVPTKRLNVKWFHCLSCSENYHKSISVVSMDRQSPMIAVCFYWIKLICS